MTTGAKTRAGDEQFCGHLRFILINMAMMTMVGMLLRMLLRMLVMMVTLVVRLMTKGLKSSFRFRIESERNHS